MHGAYSAHGQMNETSQFFAFYYTNFTYLLMQAI